MHSAGMLTEGLALRTLPAAMHDMSAVHFTSAMNPKNDKGHAMVQFVCIDAACCYCQRWEQKLVLWVSEAHG